MDSVGELKECYTYRDKEWVIVSEMNEIRAVAALSRTPSNGLFVTGGDDL